MNKIRWNIAITLGVLCVYVFGYITLRSSLHSISIDYFELIDARNIASGILYIFTIAILITTVFAHLPIEEIIIGQSTSSHDTKTTTINGWHKVSNCFMSVFGVFFAYEGIILRNDVVPSVNALSIKNQVIMFGITIIIYLTIKGILMLYLKNSISTKLIDNVLMLIVLVIASLYLLSVPVLILLLILVPIILLLGQWYYVVRDSSSNRRESSAVLFVLYVFLLPVTGSVLFGVYALPVVNDVISPFGFYRSTIYIKEGEAEDLQELVGSETITGCVMFETSKDYFISPDKGDLSDLNILRVSKSITSFVEHSNSGATKEGCYERFHRLRTMETFYASGFDTTKIDSVRSKHKRN